ncbi:ABC transporter substrate-binding protein [Paenibacillus soyae]|uniref:Extracellular solute-binding protein n=1 Tax=Paenibacillus soyae TaxID=2969249 RepID=A0A9X2MUB4_9BACL|nr:extracellular solute-binding protein [Paenibacillus soyae]MCR2806414.1 extracellular solute-binding protein [Paenibacillus soyae]
MKYKLKYAALFALYAVALSAVVLYSLTSGANSGERAESEKLTLTFRHFWTKEHDRPILTIFQDAVREFELAHPNVKINFESLDQTIHREQKLKSEMVTGTPPDMFVLFGGAEFEPYVKSNRMMDLTEFVRDNRLNFHDLRLWSYGDRVYGLPFEGHAEPIFYNRSIFEELDLAVPETIGELTEAIRVLKQNGYVPFALGNEELWPGTIYTHYLMDRYAGPKLIDQLAGGESRSSFQNEDYRKAFALLQEWSKEGAFNASPSGVSTEEAIALFTGGKAAMYLNGSWDITLFHSEDGSSSFQDRIGVIPFPSLSKDDDRSIAGGYSIGLGLSSELTGARKEAALELLRTLYTEKVQQRIVYEGLRLPAMPVPFDPSRTGPVFAQVVQLMEDGGDTFIAYDNVLSPEVRKSFWSINDRLLNLELSPDEALAELDHASEWYWQLRNR